MPEFAGKISDLFVIDDTLHYLVKAYLLPSSKTIHFYQPNMLGALLEKSPFGCLAAAILTFVWYQLLRLQDGNSVRYKYKS